MTRRWRLGLPAGIALIVLTNAILLIGVVVNRSGQPEARLELTERELQLRRRFGRENSGITLRLAWRVRGGWAVDWLNPDKLRELGFDLSVSPEDDEGARYYRWVLPRDAWIVLEYDGTEWQRELADAEQHLAESYSQGHDDWRLRNAEERVRRELHMGSRLFAIDAGTDPAALRERYPDTHRYAIVPGAIRMIFERDRRLVGRVAEVVGDVFHVPYPQSQLLTDLEDTDPDQDGPRYRALVAYGSRYEPWLLELDRTEAIATQ